MLFFVDLLETLVTKITIGCKRRGTDITISKILRSERMPLFYIVENLYFTLQLYCIAAVAVQGKRLSK